MKNQNGITLTILVATIVLLSIMLGTISYNVVSIFKLKEYYNLYSDIEILDEKIAIYYAENDDLPVTNESQNISSFIEDYTRSNINYNPNNSGNLKKIDLEKLNNISLNYDEYYIDEQSHTIYSQNPVELNQVIYYTIPEGYEEVEL